MSFDKELERVGICIKSSFDVMNCHSFMSELATGLKVLSALPNSITGPPNRHLEESWAPIRPQEWLS